MTASHDRVGVRVPIERGRGTQSLRDCVGRSGTQWDAVEEPTRKQTAQLNIRNQEDPHMTTVDYFASLPERDRSRLASIARKYLDLDTVPDRATALKLLEMQHLEIDVLDAHVAHLTEAKAAVEAKADRGRNPSTTDTWNSRRADEHPRRLDPRPSRRTEPARRQVPRP